MPRGRPPKPAAVHALNGNPGKRKRTPDTAPLAAGAHQVLPGKIAGLPVPAPPKGMTREAQAYWRELAPRVVHLGLLRELDEGAFKEYCEVRAEIDQLRARLKREGRYYRHDGLIKRHPGIADLAKLRGELRAIGGKFGFSPEDRAKVSHVTDPVQPRLPLGDDAPPAGTGPATGAPGGSEQMSDDEFFAGPGRGRLN